MGRKLVLMMFAFSLTALVQAQQEKRAALYCDGYTLVSRYGSFCESCKYTTCCYYACDTCQPNCTTTQNYCTDCGSGPV
jgi:hypothetical protein